MYNDKAFVTIVIYNIFEHWLRRKKGQNKSSKIISARQSTDLKHNKSCSEQPLQFFSVSPGQQQNDPLSPSLAKLLSPGAPDFPTLADLIHSVRALHQLIGHPSLLTILEQTCPLCIF